ncbi:hypothetical protein [Halobacteriovorax sp.]|uniref:hypothetical protein n=1 Tax=Halobacteriovorax sp. TaxID=2020862 RepID=UPI003568AD11
MKKFSITILAVALVLSVIYFLSKETEVVVTESNIVQDTSVPKKKSEIKINTEDESFDAKAEEEFETAQFDQYLEKVEDEWNKNMENLFLVKSSNSDKFLREYNKLKNGYEKERERRYEAFHEMMEAKYGPNYSYSPSADEEMFNEKLVKVYEENLSKIIGKEKMIEYMKVKDSFNRKLEEEAGSSESYLLIEF